MRSELPDMVLLDVNMPHKDGFAVLEEIRSDPVTQHIPVIILTAARLEPSEVQSGLNMGADDYVTKPFDRRELLARIRTKRWFWFATTNIWAARGRRTWRWQCAQAYLQTGQVQVPI